MLTPVIKLTPGNQTTKLDSSAVWFLIHEFLFMIAMRIKFQNNGWMDPFMVYDWEKVRLTLQDVSPEKEEERIKMEFMKKKREGRA